MAQGRWGGLLELRHVSLALDHLLLLPDDVDASTSCSMHFGGKLGIACLARKSSGRPNPIAGNAVMIDLAGRQQFSDPARIVAFS